MGAKTLYVFRRILLPLVLPAAAAITALNFNSMLDDYDTAIFLAHPLVQPLGLVIKANTDGAEGVAGVANRPAEQCPTAAGQRPRDGRQPRPWGVRHRIDSRTH